MRRWRLQSIACATTNACAHCGLQVALECKDSRWVKVARGSLKFANTTQLLKVWKCRSSKFYDAALDFCDATQKINDFRKKLPLFNFLVR
jgi:hypothetical protein